MNQKRLREKGFTLIELLIVIVIIGILSGILLTVINPAAQRDRANQTVMKSNADKIRMAALACNTSRASLASCNNFAAIQVADPTGTPAGSTYSYAANAVTATINACSAGTIAACTGCLITDTITAAGVWSRTLSAGCVIDQ
jgi:general secretion pathway protein G